MKREVKIWENQGLKKKKKNLKSVIEKMWDIIFSSERHHLTCYLNLQKEIKVFYICVILIITLKVLAVKVTQLCLTLCNLMEFSRPEHWSGQPFPSPGDLPSLGIKSRSLALQVDSLPAEPQGKIIQVSSSPFYRSIWEIT